MDFRTKFPDRAEKADVTSEKREQSKELPSIAKTSELGQKSLQAPPPESPAALMRNIYQAAMEEADATLQCGEEQREAIVKEAIAAWIDAAADPVIATKLFEQDLESHGHFVERGGNQTIPIPALSHHLPEVILSRMVLKIASTSCIISKEQESCQKSIRSQYRRKDINFSTRRGNLYPIFLLKRRVASHIFRIS